MTIKQPLYGHTSEATAYVVADYPYGFRERTQIRYWLENRPGKGFRFVSQTLNPKTDRWNKPKASTYIEFAAGMYLDENDHVQWTGVGSYTDGAKALEFAENFPGADNRMLQGWAARKAKHSADMLSGRARFVVNGVVKEPTERDLVEYKAELQAWTDVAEMIRDRSV